LNPTTPRRTSTWRTPCRERPPAAGSYCRVSSGIADRPQLRRGAQQPGIRTGQFRRALAGGHCPVSGGAAAQSRSGRGARQSGTRAGQFRRAFAGSRCRVSSGAKDRSRVRRGPQQLGTRAGQFRRALAGGRCPVSSGAADRSRSRRGAREPGERAFHLPGRLPDAIAEYQAALRIQPRYANAHNDLGLALANSGVGRRPSPSTKRHCASIPILPRRTSTWETRSPSSPAGCRMPSLSMKQCCGSGPIRSCGKW